MLSLPIALAGMFAAHQLGYVLAAPAADARSALMLRDGHEYFSSLIYFGMAATTVLLAGMFMLLRRYLSSGERATLDSRLFLLVCPLIFIVQENAERAGVGELANPAMWIEPAFVAGLLLQVPFALVAWFSARMLLRVVLHVAQRIDASIRKARVIAPAGSSSSPARYERRSSLRLLFAVRPLRGPPARLAL